MCDCVAHPSNVIFSHTVDNVVQSGNQERWYDHHVVDAFVIDQTLLVGRVNTHITCYPIDGEGSPTNEKNTN